MKIRAGEPLSGLKSLCKNVWNTWTGGVWNKIQQWKTFGGIFSDIHLDSSIIDGMLLTNLIFLASYLEVLTLNTKWWLLHARDFKEMAKILTEQQNDLNFDRRKTLRKSTITFNYRIVDGHIEFPYCMLLFDKFNKSYTKLKTAVTWSKSNLNIMNIYEEKYHQFLDM